MANALGFPDRQYLPWPQMLEAVARVCRAVQVPVTADIESGFAANVTALETSITQIIHAGAVGVNLEDVMPAHPDQNADLQSANLQTEMQKIAALENTDPKTPSSKNADPSATATRFSFAGTSRAHPGRPTRRPHREIHLVIKPARTLIGKPASTPTEAMRNTLERAKAYLQAGADCIFIPGLRNPDHIKTVIGDLRAVQSGSPRSIFSPARASRRSPNLPNSASTA